MSNARLVSIHFDDSSLSTRMNNQDGYDSNASIINAHPCAILGMPANDYTLYLTFVQDKKGSPTLSLSLLNEAGKAVKARQVPLSPMFSRFADIIDLMEADLGAMKQDDLMDNENIPLLAFAKAIGSVNELSAGRLQSFKDLLGEFCVLEEQHQEMVSSLFSRLIFDSAPLIVTERAQNFQGNIAPPSNKKH